MKKSETLRGGLSDRQKKAIPFFVNSPTVNGGCKAAKISYETYYQWLANPLFKDELIRYRGRVVEEALNVMKANMTKAVNVLVGLLETKNEYLKRSVANDVLMHVLKGKELDDLEGRIVALEKIVREKLS